MVGRRFQNCLASFAQSLLPRVRSTAQWNRIRVASGGDARRMESVRGVALLFAANAAIRNVGVSDFFGGWVQLSQFVLCPIFRINYNYATRTFDSTWVASNYNWNNK